MRKLKCVKIEARDDDRAVLFYIDLLMAVNRYTQRRGVIWAQCCVRTCIKYKSRSRGSGQDRGLILLFSVHTHTYVYNRMRRVVYRRLTITHETLCMRTKNKTQDEKKKTMETSENNLYNIFLFL